MCYLDFVYYFIVYYDRLAKHTNPLSGGTSLSVGETSTPDT